MIWQDLLDLESLQELLRGLHGGEKGRGSCLAVTAGRQHVGLECCARKLFNAEVVWAKEVLQEHLHSTDSRTSHACAETRSSCTILVTFSHHSTKEGHQVQQQSGLPGCL